LIHQSPTNLPQVTRSKPENYISTDTKLHDQTTLSTESNKRKNQNSPSDRNKNSCILFQGKQNIYINIESPGSKQHQIHLESESNSISHQYIKQVFEIFHSGSSPPKNINENPLFIFEFSENAAQHNAIVLEQFNFNVNSAIQAQKHSQVFYGSEFKSPDLLEKIFKNHPLWSFMKQILSDGASYPLKAIPEEIRKADLNFHKERGNHKSAQRFNETIINIIKEDIEHGFALILPIQLLEFIKNASLAPIGCTKQMTINSLGERVPKYRMTHDQSFLGPSGTSVNDRTIQEDLPPLVYGFCLKRIIHYIIKLRSKHPNKKIFISKFDFDAAYRRCHMSAQSAQESLTIVGGFLIMALRLTFGGSPCPNLWSCISESITDLCNMLIQNPNWNHDLFFDPLSASIEPPLSEYEDVPFTESKETSVSIPDNDLGKSDVYIDDIIAISLEDHYKRICAASILAIHTVARPVDPIDPIPRKEIISLKKFAAEARPSELKTVLGWAINTRCLRIYLPMDKFSDWHSDIQEMLKNPKVDKKQMESLIGRLDHVAFLMDMLRHFMSRLRNALQRTIKTRFTTLSLSEMEDLKLMDKFLNIASSSGVSLNLLTFRKPTHLYRSDASLHGLGGYNIVTGRAWRIELPVDCRFRTSLNALEFIATVIAIWIDKLNNDLPPESCILSQSDSSSATGWLRKSNFSDKEETIVQLTTARKVAELILDSETCLYSQWFPGDQNDVSDACSRDFHLSDNNLTHLILTSIPEQTPNGFFLSEVPQEIYSWLTSMLRQQPQQQVWSQEPTRSKLSLGQDTSSTSSRLQSKTTTSSNNSPSFNETKSWEPLHTPFEMGDFIKTSKVSKQKQLEPPSIAWHRPTVWPIDPIQGSTKMDDLHSFYFDSYEDIRSSTLPQNNKLLLPEQSSESSTISP